MALRRQTIEAQFADATAARRAARQLWQAGFWEVRVTPAHHHPAAYRPALDELGMTAMPDAVASASVTDFPVRTPGGVRLTLVTTADRAREARWLLRQFGASCR